MKLVILIALAVVAVSALINVEHQREWNKGSYIIQLEDVVTTTQRKALIARIEEIDPVNEITHQYSIINGFAGRFSKQTIQELRKMESTIKTIEEDGIAHAIASCSQSDQTPSGAWGIRRTSFEGCLGTLPNTYRFPQDAGAGTFNYVLDTGVRYTHEQFTGRTTADDECASFVVGENCYEDFHGHGTHVAGTLMGNTVGMARGSSTVVGVTVLARRGSGPWSGVISGIEWSVSDARARNALCGDARGCKSTANMSLGGGPQPSADAAVNNADNAGLLVVVAAGNFNVDACNTTPARATGAFTIGSTTETDARSSFSNFGTCVDIFAPGSSIYSAYFTSDSAYRTMSGTSMSAPHIAGAAAIEMAVGTYRSTAAIKSAMTSNANTNCVSNPGSESPNVLGYSCA